MITLEQLETLNPRPCQEALAWVKSQPSMLLAWNNCERADWMLWLLEKVALKSTPWPALAHAFADRVSHVENAFARFVRVRAAATDSDYVVTTYPVTNATLVADYAIKAAVDADVNVSNALAEARVTIIKAAITATNIDAIAYAAGAIAVANANIDSAVAIVKKAELKWQADKIRELVKW